MIYCLQVGAEIPMDSEDADEANRNDNDKTLLCVFERGWCLKNPFDETEIHDKQSDGLWIFEFEDLVSQNWHSF